MSQSLLAILVASLPLAALAWTLGWLAEQTRIGPRARAAIWQLAVLAPLFLAPAVWAVANLDLTGPAAVSTSVSVVAVPGALPGGAVPPTGMAPPAAAAEMPPTLPVLPYAGLVLALIACGSIVKLAGSLGRNLRLGNLLAHSHPCDAPELKTLLEDAARQAAIRSPGLRLWVGGEPVLVGALRPVILLPERLARDLAPERIAHVFCHELAHLKAHDHWRLPLLDVLTSLFWFNPPLAACAARLMSAQEEACDARALRGADRRMRRAYAETLFNLLKAGAVAEPAVAFTGWRRSLAVRRLRAILSPPPVSAARNWLSVGLAGLALVGGLASAAYAIAASLPAPAPAQPQRTSPSTPSAARPTPASAASGAPRVGAIPAAGQRSGLSANEQSMLDTLSSQADLARSRADAEALRAAGVAVTTAENRYRSAQADYDLGLVSRDQLDEANLTLARAKVAESNLLAQQAEGARNLALISAGAQPRPALLDPAPLQPTMTSTLATALAQARVERIRQETILDQVRRTPVEALPGLIDDAELKRQAASLESARRPPCPLSMGSGGCPGNEAQIQRTLDQMTRRAQAITVELSAKLDLTRAQEAALQSEIDRVRRGSN